MDDRSSTFDQTHLERISEFVLERFTLRQCRRYVRENFEHFLAEKGGTDAFFELDDCVCGRSFAWHSAKNLVVDNSLSWTLMDDTSLVATNSFGKMFFVPGEGLDSSTFLPGASADYLRLQGREISQSYLDDVYTLMTSPNLWALPSPQLVIEVIGVAKMIQHLDQEIMDRFTSGLIAAAMTSKAWIVSCGINTDILGLVGDAFSKQRMTHPETKITCVGITSWGIVNNRDQLITMSEDSMVHNFGTTNKDSQANGHSYEIEINGEELEKQDCNEIQELKLPLLATPRYTLEGPEHCQAGVPLSPAQNCFLLVDNGKEKRFGEEVDFRYQFLRYISQKTFHGSGGTSVKIPSVLIVVGGGLRTLRMVELSMSEGEEQEKVNSMGLKIQHSSIDRHDSQPRNYWRRPVVIVPHFGGLSDLLAYALEITSSSTDKKSKFFRPSTVPGPVSDDDFPSDFDERIKNHAALEDLTRSLSENVLAREIEKVLISIRFCVKHRSMITVVDLEDNNLSPSFDEIILNVVLQSNLGSAASMFELAQLWNCSEIARQLMGRHEVEIRKKIDIKPAVMRAVIFGQSEFFKLFVESRLVDLHSFLTLRQIRFFYIEIFLKCHGKAGRSSCIWMVRSMLLNTIAEHLLSDSANPLLMRNIGDVLSRLLGCYMDNVFTDEMSYKVANRDSPLEAALTNAQPHSKPYATSKRDLFILQLLLNRNDLATYIWKIGHDHIGTALMASIFLKSLAKEAKRLDMTDAAMAYHNSAFEWQDRAILVLRKCYEENPVICSRLLNRSLQTWQSATLLEIAFYGNVKRFMAEPAVQTTLAQIWRGQMATFTSQTLISLTLIPFLLPFLISKIRFEISSHGRFAGAEQHEMPAAPTTRRNALTLAALWQMHDPKKSFTPFSAPMSRDRDVKLSHASLFHFKQESRISVPRAVYLLYSSPIAKYLVHSFTALMFLFVFSSLVLDTTVSTGVNGHEIVVWIWCLVYFLDVLREGFGKTNLSFAERLEDFFCNLSVIAELISLSLVISAVVLRVGYLLTVDYVYAHTIYALACILYWIKSMRFFFVTKTVGPKVNTLVKMMRDLVFFLLLYVILLLSFSLPIYSLLYPNEHVTDVRTYFAILLDSTYGRVWNVFVTALDESKRLVEGTCHAVGDINEPISDNNNSTELIDAPTGERCSSRNIIAIILYIIFLLLSNIMLLNMLIAMFSHTVDETRSKATRRWRFDMYRFLWEYYNRPVLPGPLMIPELIYRFAMFVYQRTCGVQSPENTDLKHFYPSLCHPEYRKLEIFEKRAAELALVKGNSNTNVNAVSQMPSPDCNF